MSPAEEAPKPLTAAAGFALQGRVTVPGDKSISHRALIFGALAVGESRIAGLLEGEDVLNTARALSALGAGIERQGAGSWRVWGLGAGGLAEPAGILDLGNSGTGARLLLGVAAAHPFTSFFTGDASLRRRPMARVIEPLERMGASFTGRSGHRLPLAVTGSGELMPIEYRLPVPSAQVKSAVLLAGLHAPGATIVLEDEPTRDHTENLLRHFGAKIAIEPLPQGGRAIRLEGEAELAARAVTVPGDPSSAAFLAVAATIVPGSEICIENVGTNPLRFGLFETLKEMGADIALENPREEGGEPMADLRVRAARLKGIEVPPERAPSMIDEYPILAVAAACAEGPTIMTGIGELRVKESDRIRAMAQGLRHGGVAVEESPTGLTVFGQGGRPPGGGLVTTDLDHRIAMSFLILGLTTEKPVTIDDARMIDTSFPGFVALMQGLGAAIAPKA